MAAKSTAKQMSLQIPLGRTNEVLVSFGRLATSPLGSSLLPVSFSRATNRSPDVASANSRAGARIFVGSDQSLPRIVRSVVPSVMPDEAEALPCAIGARSSHLSLRCRLSHFAICPVQPSHWLAPVGPRFRPLYASVSWSAWPPPGCATPMRWRIDSHKFTLFHTLRRI
jgi:hypothetical protein